jgi:chromosome segregation ATPase
VPRTLLKILALEQGETHKLAQRSPEQLLEYVLELQGDKQVLERYAEARSEYMAGQRDMEDLERRLQTQAIHVDVLRRDADQYRELQGMLAQEKELRDHRLPAARLKQLIRDAEDLRRDRDKSDAVLRAAEAVLAGFTGDSEQLRLESQALQRGIENKRKHYQVLVGEKEKLDGQWRDLKRFETELQELQAAGGLVEADEVQRLRDERQRLVAGEAQTRRDLSQVVEQISQLRGELSHLDSGQSRRPPPENTAQVLRELRREGIEGTLVADVIEILDPAWQVAVESVLGSARFTVLVDPQHELAGRKIGQRLKYRNYITGWDTARRPQVRAGSALSVVQIADHRLPDHIVQMLASVQLVNSVDDGHKLGRQTSITPDGYRGGRSPQGPN